MTPHQEISQPTPSICVAVGQFAVEVCKQVRSSYSRSDERRSAATIFLSLHWVKDQLTLLPLDTAIEAFKLQNEDKVEEETDSSLGRRQFFQHIVLQSEHIRNTFEADLFDIRAHGKLAQAGWSEEYDIPTNIYLIADVKESISAGTVLPLLHLLESIAENTHLCNVHALLNIGVFPMIGSPVKKQELERYTFLLELDNLLTDDSENREKLSRLLDCECTGFDRTTIYLFDSRKEGTYVVKDDRQMQVMVSNALLSLMQKDFARQVSIRHDRYEITDQKAFYNSIGSSMIGYDPDSFQEACAKRLSREFAETILLAPVSDEQVAVLEAEKLENEFGGLRDWFQHCFNHLPSDIGKIWFQKDTNLLSINLSYLKLRDIDYERIHHTQWFQQFHDYDLHFMEKSFPSIVIVVNDNAQKMGEVFQAYLKTRIDTLPALPEVYPGGITNAIACLGLIEEYLKGQQRAATLLQNELNKANALIDAQINKKTERIKELFEQAPTLPWIIQIMPRFIRTWAAPFYYARRYGKKLYEAIHLKEEVIELLQNKSAGLIQNETIQRICIVVSGLTELTTAGKQDYQALLEKIVSAASQLPTEWPELPFGDEDNCWDALFRVPVVDLNLARWGYERFRPSLKKWGSMLLIEDQLFEKWREITPQNINEALFCAGKKIYQPLWNISLEEIFSLQEEWKREGINDHTFDWRMIETSCHSAVPLIRPDFDAAGGSAISSLSSHALIGMPEWRSFKVPESLADLLNIETVYTGDKFIGLFTRIRHSVPLLSLDDLIRQSKHRYQSLSEHDRHDFRIISSSGEIISPLSGAGGSEDPDIECVTFTWQFKPRGSGTEFHQQLSINLSKKRFEYYRRRVRFSDKWNKYAEEEMPEVRALATEFQRLHSQHNWNTFNQVSNVLKFVQKCVHYSLDKDTTGHSEWPRYPIETIKEGIGDCEDVAILCAAILARLGFQVVLLSYPGHMAFGVAGAEKLNGEYIHVTGTDRRYFYGEATSEGWHIGQIPPSYRNTTPEILPVNILIDEEETDH
jgi:hypothetical protein